MNWRHLRAFPWLDTRARFVAGTPSGGALLDIGSWDGGTLGHFAELRPDLRYFATDIEGQPERYPAGCKFHRGDLRVDPLPWPDGTIDRITCMHLVEHLGDLTLLLRETARLLKPGGQAYFETPHPKSMIFSSPRGEAAGRCTVNFFDDPQHVRPVTLGSLAGQARAAGLEVGPMGTSRNWLFAAAWLVCWLLPPSHQKYTAYLHWTGWSVYLVAKRPA
ncbi:MAG TPA: class I SAM-dependent methyltransferase [Candidatus Paceibacterota bacterium]|nr:class I SAM-dependent methyltransferase [Verrucomicrobiota bacterium]HOX01024.1 class I SAM-dependent methyltransferase [Verrucomicrobiota bacterium]HRZ43872.1 class I SAM-dependent methyltransferase [Candidatus Paceibacterota bacterium]